MVPVEPVEISLGGIEVVEVSARSCLVYSSQGFFLAFFLFLWHSSWIVEEELRDEEIGNRADIFSLSCIF